MLSSGTRDSPRRKVVLVVGDGHQPHEKKSAAVGEWIAANNWHLLTGGGAGVMRAVSRAFHDFQRDSLAIGVIPGVVHASDGKRVHRPRNEHYPNPWVDLAIFTHLEDSDPEGPASRNHINVLSADLIIALPGGPGTSAEIHLAKEYGKPVVVFISGEEAIDGRSREQLSSEGFVLVPTFRELVIAARAILTPETEARRESLRIQLSACALRFWQWSDAESLQRHANNKNVSRNLLDEFPNPYTIRDAERWLATEQSSRTVFAIDVGGNAVGGIGFTPRNDGSSEVGYWLGEDYWGRGIATEALCAVTSYAFTSQPELHRLCAHVFTWNVSSMRVLEKAGYIREGLLHDSTLKNGRYVDEVLFAKVRTRRLDP